MSAALNKGQKAYLAQLFERAFNQAAAVARGRGEEPAVDTKARTTWRHQEVAKACGKLGLRCCSQADYKRVEAHVLDLLGEAGKAFNAHVRAETNERRIAEWKLVQTCKEFGFHLAYAEAICRRQHNGLGLDDVDEKALWNLMFTVRNRGLARRKQQLKEAA
jgi:hypothetical protein